MSSFLRELKHRRVYRVAIGYAVAAWLAIQIAATVLPAFHTPEFVLPVLIILFGIGFPVALVLAWAFDVTPSGIEKSDAGSGTSAGKHARHGWLLAGAGVLIAALSIGGYWIWHSGGPATQTRASSATTNSDSVSMPNSAAPSAVSAKSIAVLPFENLSDDKQNSFFTDGVQTRFSLIWRRWRT